MASGRSEPGAEESGANYYLPTDIETTRRYGFRGRRRGRVAFDRMHEVPCTDDPEWLQGIVNPSSPEFDPIARRIQEGLEKLDELVPEYR